MTSALTNQSIFLVGPMGSGKSAVGRRLARDLHRDFIDSDTFIEQRTGVEIAYIFDKEGEAGFRKREQDAIDVLTRRDGIVLATGGGVVLAPESRAWLASRGRVVYLHATVVQQLKRTRRSKDRPLLQAGDREQTLTDLMAIRDPLYREIAELCVETDGCVVVAVAAEVRRRLDLAAD